MKKQLLITSMMTMTMAALIGVVPGVGSAATEEITLLAETRIVQFHSSYDGTEIVGVLATPALSAQIVDNRGTVPAVVLLHGYTSPFRTGHRPIDFNRGVTDEDACDFELDEADYQELELKSYYRDLVDYFTDRGVVVFMPDSFSGRCISSFLGRQAPDDTNAHAFKRAGDAYAALHYLVTEHRYISSRRVGVAGLWHGGSAALLAVADVEQMTRAPFAPTAFTEPSYGYRAPPSPHLTWRFAAALNINGGTGYNGYLGTNDVTIGDEISQAEGLYSNYAPVLILCGRDNSTCYEDNGATEYGKLDSLVQKALVTAPEVEFSAEVFADAGSEYMIASRDDEHVGNAQARVLSLARIDAWFLPKLNQPGLLGHTVVESLLPAGRSIVSFHSDYDGVEVLGMLAVPDGEAHTIDGRVSLPAIVLMHGSSGLWKQSPLDYHSGAPGADTPNNCAPVFSSDDYDQFEIKSSYSKIVDFFVERGVVVFMPDSFSGRCLESFKNKKPPNDVYAHPFTRAQDAYESLRYLRNLSPVSLWLSRVGVGGISHGGSSAILAVADVERMDTCPYAPRDYRDAEDGYEPLRAPSESLHFAAAVNFYGGMGFYGYLGTNSADHDDVDQARGLYGNYAPLLMVGGDDDSIYYVPDDPSDDEYEKFTSFLLKADLTTPEVPVAGHVFPDAGHSIMDPGRDDDYPANVAARAAIYRLLASELLPTLQFQP